jgi:hypothetical protein
MGIRTLVTAAAILSFSATGSAEPPKAPVRKAEQPAGQQPVVIAAANETPQPVAGNAGVSTPEKPVRRARVTTCRCGGQDPGN